MTSPDSPRALYWQRHTAGDGRWRDSRRPTGQDLAALRRGLGRQAGDVPQMWPFYSHLRDDGTVSAALRAEHVALALFAVHQQGKDHPMHRHGVGLGAALLAARRSGKFSPDGLDRRFAAAATASSLAELIGHLRGLITQLRAVEAAGRRGQPLDYTQLFKDLRDWQRHDDLIAVRRRWGGQYFTLTADDASDDPVGEPATDTPSVIGQA